MAFSTTPIEAVRNYWDSRPCNIRHSTAPVGTREYFDQVEARKYFVEPHIPAFADFDRWKGKRVLEIGCGIGTAAIGFARAGAIYTGVDLSEESLKLARRRAQVYGYEDRMSFHLADAERLQDAVPIEKYDLVYSFGVIHHTPHPSRVIDQLAPYCRPGTTLKLMVYNRWSWKVLWILFTHGKGRFWRLREMVAENSEAQTGCPITYTYTPAEMKDMLQRRGFRIDESFVDHIFAYEIPRYVKYEYVREWYFRWMPQPMFRALERALGWHLCVTAEYAGLGRRA